MSALISDIAGIALDAGRAILDVYESGDFGVSLKTDNSPLTEADKRSHEIIERGLTALAPGIPVLSEEGKDIAYEVRKKWRRFFLVDPLDGTKEFIKRNGEFTVNIALIEDAAPVLGVIYVPVKGLLYRAEKGKGAYKIVNGSNPVEIKARKARDIEGVIVASSRSHGSNETESFLGRLQIANRISVGSSLKFCLVAEGMADIYPRFGPTWEWDTAAGHALVIEAGGVVTDTSGNNLLYNKEVLKHSGFIASSSSSFKMLLSSGLL